MSKDPLSKIRAGDVYKQFMRVLSEYRIERADWTIVDKRPHPILTVRYVGLERSMSFPGSPSGRGSAAKYAGVLRRLLKSMQMEALDLPPKATGAAARLASDAAPASSRNLTGNETVPDSTQMSIFTTLPSGEPTMSSREIAELVEKRHDNVKRTIETLINRGTIGLPQIEEYPDGLGRPAQQYRIGKRDSYIIVAQLSPEFTARLVDRWQELESERMRPLTPAEMFLQNAQAMVAIERRQLEHTEQIAALDSKVERIEAAQTVMVSRPANAESITRIRERIGKRYGLSETTINEVMWQSPYAPKPAGTVRNDHVDAEGTTYTVFWVKDVTAVFERFVKECQAETPVFFTHPFIKSRFKMVPR